MAADKASEPTRPLATPRIESDGTVRGKTRLSPLACKVRGRLVVPPSKVIPIILIPGIMGTNLRANSGKGAPVNAGLKPREEAWRPPNGKVEGGQEVAKWRERDPALRQKILDGPTLEVDPGGTIDLPPDAATIGLRSKEAKLCGWGEVHSESYGPILLALRKYFHTFFDCDGRREPEISADWSGLNSFPRQEWGAPNDPVLKSLTKAELRQLADHHYPVYAFGYNWLLSNETSALQLMKKVEEVVGYFRGIGQTCPGVLLVSHSMGGLVARACAKQIPDLIAGVVHTCMPALGAPVCYRRIACGTESSSPTHGLVEKAKALAFSKIAGPTALETTPAMAFSPGALELLPTHRYPGQWLSASRSNEAESHHMKLPAGSPYDLYREKDAWYRLFNRDIADPAEMHKDQLEKNIIKTINQAQKFHEQILDDFYHPNTYAIYGADKTKSSLAKCNWVYSSNVVIASDELMRAKLIGSSVAETREVELADGTVLKLTLSQQDSPGDGTVPTISAAAPRQYVKGTFPTSGYDHQGIFSSEGMELLTIQLVARAILGR